MLAPSEKEREMATTTLPELGPHGERHLLAGASTLFTALLLFAGAVFGLTAGVGAVWTAVTGSGTASAVAAPASGAAAAPAAVQIKLAVHDAFVPATFTMKVGTTYDVTVVNYDTMPHTWTAPGLGVNAQIKAGTGSGPATTTFTVRPTKAGTYNWQCETPCDPWAMVHNGYMRGSVTVEAA
jgi:plastocyanin